MKIVVLGSTGMLGSAVGRYFCKEYGNSNVLLTYCNNSVSYGQDKVLFDPLKHDLYSCLPDDYDAVINCIGIIKPFIMRNIPDSIYINSIFPWKLADFCLQRKIKLIHISTDCVFSGSKGCYTESSLHDCLDVYGKTKSLGEPSNCMVLRTSIIGEEIHKKVSFIEWAKSQRGKEVNGFTNHLWNGITTLQYAKICQEILERGLYEPSLFHVFSNVVTKEQLLRIINNRFQLDLSIKACEAPEPINRTLSTEKSLNSLLNIPSLEDQINQI